MVTCLALLITLLFASRPACSLHLGNPTSIHSLVSRQLAGNFDPSLIPDQCKSDCQDIVTSLTVLFLCPCLPFLKQIINYNQDCTNSGTLDQKCICTDWNVNAISDCFACEEKEIGLDDSEAQATLNDFVYACNGAGYSVHTGVVGYSHNGVSPAKITNFGAYLTVPLGMIILLGKAGC